MTPHPEPDAGSNRELVVDVPERLAGDRLDRVVADLAATSRSRAATRIDAGDVTLAGVVRPRSHRVVGGERLVVAAVPVPTPTPAPPLPAILFRDDDVLVLDKPAGLVVHPGHGHPDGTLVDALLAAGLPATGGDPDRPGIVHRLDKDTSGAMAVALSERAFAELTRALRDHDVTRSYVALVADRLPAARGTVDVPLGRDPTDRTRFAADPSGRHAVTHFVVQADGVTPEGRPVQLVACRLETGRTHQIRVHLAHAGAPVVGDVTYGSPPGVAAGLGLDRPFLHALHLRLAHPAGGGPIAVEAPLPDDLVTALGRAGIAAGRAVSGHVDWPDDRRPGA